MTANAKVSLIRASGYSTGLHEAVEALLEHLGGMRAFVKQGQSVLIKPNLLSDKPPERAITTHPELVRAIISLVRKAGGAPMVGDSSASAVKHASVLEKTGIGPMCAEEQVPVLNLEKEGSVAFSSQGYSFSVAKPVLEADVLISVPKVKTHVLTILTGAIKNMYGTVPGYQKAHLHKMHPRTQDFGRLLIEICAKAAPDLNIADGILGMEGDGPSAGRPVQLGFLAASSDAFALDMTLCKVLGINPRAVPYLRTLLGITEYRERADGIDECGLKSDGLISKPFRAPGTMRSRLIPGWLIRILAPCIWIRPSISEDNAYPADNA